MSKGKFFKNTLRGQDEKIQPYIPQYVIRGVEPETINSGLVPEIITPVKRGSDDRHVLISSQPNPRRGSMQNVNSNVPFAPIQNGPSPIGSGPIPNIGNNIENNWSSVDGQVFDDISDDPIMIKKSSKIIDNNDYYNPTDAEYTAEATEDNIKDFLSLKDYDYVLLVFGEVISTGFLDDIQEEVKALIFGEHSLCKMCSNITQEDITVLKRVEIKVGVFLE